MSRAPRRVWWGLKKDKPYRKKSYCIAYPGVGKCLMVDGKCTAKPYVPEKKGE